MSNWKTASILAIPGLISSQAGSRAALRTLEESSGRGMNTSVCLCTDNIGSCPALFFEFSYCHVQPHIHEFNFTAERVADICGLNKRTLTRKLQARGTSITQELAEMRKTLAEKELVNTNRHIAEIAAMVGYLNPTVFSRAFKRWTGVSPREFRKQSQV